VRILIAVHGFPPTHSAGAERQAERMAIWMAQHGHRVEVFTVERVNAPDFHLETAIEGDLTVHRLHFNLYQSDDELTNEYDNPAIGRALRSILATTSFDLAHIISGYLLGTQAIEAIHEAGIQLVVSPMEYWFLCAQINLIQPAGHLCSGPESIVKCTRCLMETKRRYRMPTQYTPALADTVWKLLGNSSITAEKRTSVKRRQHSLRHALSKADGVICNSRFLITLFDRYGYDTQHYSFVRQGLNIPETLPPRSDNPDTLRLIYVGQIQPHKGIDLLVSAAIKLLDMGCPITLDLWGSESQAPEYTANLKARSMPYPSIHWNGQYNGSKVWDVLAAGDILVIPSRWYENSPNVILEAYTAGLPVIATNLGGMAELIDHDTSGLLFELNDIDDLVKQLQRLLNEPDLLSRLREGIPPVKTIDDEMQEIMSHYQRIMDGQVVRESPGSTTTN
jgi:glycosyltransferase involved in cell wall biosynthesis